jgi:hypothetical protein
MTEHSDYDNRRFRPTRPGALHGCLPGVRISNAYQLRLVATSRIIRGNRSAFDNAGLWPLS